MNLRKLRTTGTATLLSLAAAGSLAAAAAQDKPSEKTVVLRTNLVLDGRGHTLKNVAVVIADGRILRVEREPSASPKDAVNYDLRGLTVLPGWIDAHVHITYHFGPNGRAQDKDETREQAALAAAGNGYATLLAGFTTVQSIGSEEDKAVREAIERGVIPGPRLLTSLEPIFENTGSPHALRKYVRTLAAA